MTSIPHAFFDYAERHERAPAQYSRRDDVFVPHSALEVATRVARLVSWFSDLGVGASDRVALIAVSRAEWVLVDLAVMALGAIVVPVYPSLPPASVRYVLEDSGARLAIVEHDALRAGIPAPMPVLVISEREFQERLGSGEGSIGALRRRLDVHPGRDHLATIVYTSGTTAEPRGVMLTHGNLLGNMESLDALASRHPAMTVGPGDRALSFLPLSHIFERLVHLYFLVHGVEMYYSHPDRVGLDLKIVHPTVMTAVPRVLERVYAAIEREAGHGLQQRLFARARRLAVRRGEAASGGPPLRPRERALAPVYDRLVYRRIREAMGGQLRYVISGGAALPPELGRFFLGAGVPVTEGYGLTETSPVVAMNRVETIRFGRVGTPLPGVEVRLADDGEVLCRGPNVMKGYWNRPEETEAVLQDGWFHTGDLGEWDGDYLRIVDRKKAILVLSTGKNVVPGPVEQALQTSPYVETAILLGDGEKYVAALLVLAPENVLRHLSDQKVAHDRSSLHQHPAVHELLQREVERLSAPFPPHERPKTWAILPRAPSEAEGELTPSLKVKLRVVRAHFPDEVKSLYPDEATQHLRETRPSP